MSSNLPAGRAGASGEAPASTAQPRGEPARGPYTPPADRDLFPAWEKWLKAGWAVLAAAALAAGAYFLILPRFRKSPEELVRERLAAPALLSPKNSFSCDPAFSRDGSMVAYASSSGGDALHIWLQPSSGGAPRRLTRDRDRMEREPDFSPDGRSVVFTGSGSEPGIYVAAIDGSRLKRLAAGGSRPRYSPGGQWIAYQARFGWLPGGVEPASAIFVIPASGGAPRRLAAGFTHAQAPVWMDDSTLLFDGLSASGAADWFVTTVDGGAPAATGVTEVLRPAVRVWGAPESWRAGKAYFAASRGEDLDLWEIALGPGFHPAGPPRRVIAGPERIGQIALGQGDRIAFAKAASTNNLFSAELDAETGKAGQPRRLTNGEEGNRLPSVSSGGRIAYLSNRSGMPAIWLAAPEGGEATRVTGYQSVSYRPVLSSDGSHVVFSTVEEGRCRVVAMGVSDQARSYVTEGCMGVWDWSPDSSTLLVYPSTQLAAGRVEVLELDGNRRWAVLTHPSDRIFTPRFSADGKWLAFTAGPAVGEARLYVAPFRGAPIPNDNWVAAGALPGAAPAWSPDGKRLYFRSARDGFDCLWAQPLNLPGAAKEEAYPVLHLHGASPSLMRMGPFDFSLSVLGDRLVLALAEHSGTIWTASLRD